MMFTAFALTGFGGMGYSACWALPDAITQSLTGSFVRQFNIRSV